MNQHWTKAELSQLELLAGDLPRAMVISSYRSWAARNGHPRRSDTAIESATYRHGMSLRATGQWLTLGSVAAMLGVTHDCPNRWVARGLLTTRRIGKRQQLVSYVRRRDLVAFARAHPQALGGIERGRLMMLLEDEALADAIAEGHTRRPWYRKPVRCVETGRVWPTVRAAAKEVFVTRQAITYALRTRGTAAGWHWEAVG